VLPGKGAAAEPGLSAPRAAAAAPLIDGGKLPFLALGLFRLRSLRQRLIDLEPRPIRVERNNLLDGIHALTRGLEPD